jgi:sporulation protein YlmC with PRC-barrel domain
VGPFIETSLEGEGATNAIALAPLAPPHKGSAGACTGSSSEIVDANAMKEASMTRFALLGAGVALAHVAQARRPVSKRASIQGFSARRHVLGQKVYNDEGELVGRIEDLVLAKRAVSHVILGVGGFLGVATCLVAIPVGEFNRRNDRIVLQGANKKTIRALPRFEYAQISE